MKPEVQELISAMSSELRILRAILDNPNPGMTEALLRDERVSAKERTQRAAIAVGCRPEMGR